MSKATFHFDSYIVRPVCEKDRAYLNNLIEGDDYHRDRMNADFFIDLKPGEDAWAMEDEKGKVLFYFKTQTAVRVSLQFAEAETSQEKTRNSIALMKGLAWIEAQLRQNSFRQILFDSEGPELVKMAKKRMGFRESAELVRDIVVPYAGHGGDIEARGSYPEVLRAEG